MSAPLDAVAGRIALALAQGTLTEGEIEDLHSDEGLTVEAADGTDVAVWERDGEVTVFVAPTPDTEDWGSALIPETDHGLVTLDSVYHSGGSIGFAFGSDELGNRVRVAIDHRPLADIAAALEDGEEVTCCPEGWQVTYL
jgi:hypothetical protein